MFQDNGNWKEFGLSNDVKHTWFPFWLYCVSSAFVSYALSYFIYSLLDISVVDKVETKKYVENVEDVDNVENIEDIEDVINTINTVNTLKRKTKTKAKNSANNNASEMKSGYYVLDKEAYETKGIPKYIFLGSEVPDNN
jgi:hypothetical protein